MPKSDERKYFIVKHDLESFTLLPGFIWRTCSSDKFGWPHTDKAPPKFNQVKIEDCWVEFAYVSDDISLEPCSVITGFYECTREAWYGEIPLDRATLNDIADWKWDKEAWMIEGKEFGEQPNYKPVSVPPINEILGRKVFTRGTIIQIHKEDYERIRYEMRHRQLNPKNIPLLEREPLNEQELLSVVVCGYKQFGIEKIIKVQKAFPDLLVNINGNEVYLELEVYIEGFILHEHYKKVDNRKFKGDGKDVAVLCWIDNKSQVKDKVHAVYDLQSLIREGKKIVW
ncbi:MAG: hypothetical protein ABSE63_02885 [Thermoguttaceae bacterium]|jgi:hypothetical protein